MIGITPDKREFTTRRHLYTSRMKRSARNIAWIERYCRIPEGMRAGQPVRMTEHQRSWMEDIYDSPTRRYILSIPRKNYKTATTAFILLLHMGGPEAKPNSQLYSTAQSGEQSAVLFKLMAKMIRMSPDLSALFRIRDTVKEIEVPEIGTFYKALTADAKTKHGFSPVMVVHDELGQVRGPSSYLYDTMESGSAAHANPLSIVISTQAPTASDLLSRLIDDAAKGYDPKIKVRVHCCPEKVTDPDGTERHVDPFSEEALRLANPHFDDAMNRDELLEAAAAAKRMPASEASYRNLHLNQRIDVVNSFVSRKVWEENGLPPEDIRGEKVWGGLDLSTVNDLTALVLVGEKGDVLPTFWLPEDGIREKSEKDRVPYDVWARAGMLELTPGRTIEYEYVATHLRRMFDEYDVQAIAFDRYNMRHLMPYLEREGFSDDELGRFKEFGQGFASMSPALRELESKLLGGKLRHGNHPVLAMCAANAVVQKDPAENRKFTKAKATGRIDGMVALAMAVGVMPESAEEGDAGLDRMCASPIFI